MYTIAVVAGLAGVPSLAAGEVEFALHYLSVPGKIFFVEKQLKPGPDPPVLSSLNERVGFGSLGLRMRVSLPARLGPFVAGVETGFGLSAGGQTFDHRQLLNTKVVDLIEAPFDSATVYDKNDTHDGDFTRWEIMTVPLFFTLSYAPRSDTVSLGGEIGFGPMLLGINTERRLSVYSLPATSEGDLLSRITQKWQDVAVAFAVEMAGGIVVPMDETLSFHVFGGLLWLSDVSYTTTDTSPGGPALVYGSSQNDPGLKLGGLGMIVRLGLSAEI